MCLATMKLEEGKRKSTSMAKINANIAAVIAEILEKYRNQIVKEVNALIIDILDTFVQTPTTSDGKTSNQDRSVGGGSSKTKSSSSFLKTAMASAGIGTHTDPNSDFGRLNDNACVVEVTVESDGCETVWLGDDGFPMNLNDEGGDPSRNAGAYQKIPTGNIVIGSEVPELVWLDDNGKPVMLNEPLSDTFAAPLDHNYQFFENVVEQTVHDSTNTKTTLDPTKRKVQRKRSKSSSRDTSAVEKHADETVTTETPDGPSEGRTKITPRTASKSPAGELATGSSSSSLQCELCDEKLSSRWDLMYHKFAHNKCNANGEKPLECGISGKRYSTRSINKNSLEPLPSTRSNNKSSLEPLPSTRSNNKSSLEPPPSPKNQVDFECATCGRKFGTKHSLKRHIILLHLEKKTARFKCKTCGKCFPCLSIKRLHERLHTADIEFQFKCPTCARRFERKKYLWKHISNVHKKACLKKCEVCGKLVRLDNLARHRRLHSSDERIECATCGCKFSRKYILKKHLMRSLLDGKPCNNRRIKRKTAKGDKQNKDKTLFEKRDATSDACSRPRTSSLRRSVRKSTQKS